MHVSRNFVVGFFVAAGLALFVVATIFLKHWDPLSQRHSYYALFRQVKRLENGAQVLVSGVKVGEVTAIEYIGGERPVRITMRIERDVNLYSNAEVQVVPAQVIGDTTVNIKAGAQEPGTRLLAPGAVLVGAEAPELEDIVGRVSEEMVSALKGAGAILNDPDNQASFKQTMANTASLTEKMNRTFDIINQEITPLVADLRRTTEHITSFMHTAEQLSMQVTDDVSQTGAAFRDAAEEYRRAAGTLSKEIEAVSQKIQMTVGELQKTINEDQQPLHETLTQLGAASRALTQILNQINQGEGTLGKLIQDPTPFNQLKQILSGLSNRLTGQRESIFPLEKPAPTDKDPERGSALPEAVGP